MRILFAGIANFAVVLFILCMLFRQGDANGRKRAGSIRPTKEREREAGGAGGRAGSGTRGSQGATVAQGRRWTGRRTVRWIALALLLGVFIRHYTAWWLADGTYLSPQAMFYILGGAWETILCLVVLGALFMVERSVWRYIAGVAMVVGALEGAQIAVCRVAITDISTVPKNINLCDYLIGLPLGPTLAALYLIAIAYGVSKYIRTVRAGPT